MSDGDDFRSNIFFEGVQLLNPSAGGKCSLWEGGTRGTALIFSPSFFANRRGGGPRFAYYFCCYLIFGDFHFFVFVFFVQMFEAV